MPDFKNNRFKKPFSRDGGAPRQMHDAECSNCHKMTQVPFRPNGMKPVFCRDCFRPDESRGPSNDRFPKKDFNRPRPSFTPSARPDSRIDDLKRQLDAVQATLDRLVAAQESSNRSVALREEVQKHVPATKPAKKKIAKKKS